VTPPRLSLGTYSSLKGKIRAPSYDPRGVEVGHVHLGLGAFFRAHIANYSDDILDRDLRWGILAASLIHPDLARKLTSQDGIYTLQEKFGSDRTYRIIAAVRGALFAPEQSDRLLSAIADAKVQVISITVTEKGYGWEPATGGLSLTRLEIVQDKARYVNNIPSPESLLGYLAFGLRLRRLKDSGPISILSCDNLPSNGELVRRLLLEFLKDDFLMLEWLEKNVSFPNTMVDRIVPASLPSLNAEVRQDCVIDDLCPVACEPFRQWVVEDRFAGERPPWELAGVEFVADVEPFQAMKLRLLNGSHSAIAYLGLLLKFDTLDEAFSDISVAEFVKSLVKEAASTLRVPSGYDLKAYESTLGISGTNLSAKGRGCLSVRGSTSPMDPLLGDPPGQDERSAGEANFSENSRRRS
jgi:fructuronate reductase